MKKQWCEQWNEFLEANQWVGNIVPMQVEKLTEALNRNDFQKIPEIIYNLKCLGIAINPDNFEMCFLSDYINQSKNSIEL